MKIQEFDYSVDAEQALLWQYNEADRIQLLVAQKQAWYDINQRDFWSNWFRDVFNLQTANEFGLAVWSIILNLPLFVGPKPEPLDKPQWGFGADDPPPNVNQNFIHGNFSSGGTVTHLSIEEKRLLLRLRYFQLTSRCAIPEINSFLAILFEPYGFCYVLDGLDMSITIVFSNDVPSRLRYLIEQYDIIPREAGVGVKYVYAPVTAFGFGQYNQNFENGDFND